MATQKQPPLPLRERLRRFWRRWGHSIVIAVIAHAVIGGALTTLYFLTRPKPPRYVVVDLLPASATPAPTPAPASPETDAPN